MAENNKKIKAEENEIVRISIMRIPGSEELFEVHTAVCEEDLYAEDIAETILEAIDNIYEDA